jgi:hypothetical protein
LCTKEVETAIHDSAHRAAHLELGPGDVWTINAVPSHVSGYCAGYSLHKHSAADLLTPMQQVVGRCVALEKRSLDPQERYRKALYGTVMVERKLIYEVKEYTVLRISIKALMVQFFFDRCIQCTSVNRKAPRNKN